MNHTRTEILVVTLGATIIAGCLSPLYLSEVDRERKVLCRQRRVGCLEGDKRCFCPETEEPFEKKNGHYVCPKHGEE